MRKRSIDLAVGLTIGLLAGGAAGRYLGRTDATPVAAAPPAPRGETQDAPGDGAAVCECPASAGAPASTARLEARPPTPAGAGSARPALDPEPPAGATTEALRAENVHLREELMGLSRRLEDAEALQKDTEGEPIEFPKGLDKRFGETALRDAFLNAFKEVGAQGEITSIDCSEFPCIVYGEVDTRAHREAMEEAGAFVSYQKDAHSVNAWSTTVKDKSGAPKEKHQFGVAMYPRPDDQQQNETIGKRLKYRNEQVFEAMKPDEGE